MTKRPNEPPKRPDWQCSCGADLRNPKLKHCTWCIYKGRKTIN